MQTPSKQKKTKVRDKCPRQTTWGGGGGERKRIIVV